MINVKVGNSISLVTGLSAEQFKAVRLLMSYTEIAKTRYSRRFGSTRKYLIDKKGEFPTGLLYLLDNYLSTTIPAEQITRQDTRVRPALRQLNLDTMFVKKSVTPYPEQAGAAVAARTHERGIVVGPTGVGKSLIAALILDALQVPTLIVVPSLNLKRQLTDSLREAFGANKVGPLGYGRKKKYFITVENVDALDPKKAIPGFDAVLVDEFHHSGADTYRKLNLKAWDGIYYKFGLTATPFRSKNEERLLLESVLSKVIYQIPYKVAVDKGYIVPMEAYYVDVPPHKLKCKGTQWHAVYSEAVVQNKVLNEMCADMVGNLHRAGKSTLVLTKQIEHGLTIQALLEKQGINVPFAKGENEDNTQLIEDFNSQSEPVLIGTMGVLGEGVDTRPAEYVFLLGGGKSKNAFMQNCGRGFRKFKDKESCKIIMFSHTSHKWLVAHFKECKKHLKDEYEIVPERLSIE